MQEIFYFINLQSLCDFSTSQKINFAVLSSGRTQTRILSTIAGQIVEMRLKMPQSLS
jgi:hypothetical protein